jgi:hypothetical protein
MEPVDIRTLHGALKLGIDLTKNAYDLGCRIPRLSRPGSR